MAKNKDNQAKSKTKNKSSKNTSMEVAEDLVPKKGK